MINDPNTFFKEGDFYLVDCQGAWGLWERVVDNEPVDRMCVDTDGKVIEPRNHQPSSIAWECGDHIRFYPVPSDRVVAIIMAARLIRADQWSDYAQRQAEQLTNA